MNTTCHKGRWGLVMAVGWAVSFASLAQPWPEPAVETTAPTDAFTDTRPEPWLWQASVQADIQGTHGPLSAQVWSQTPLSASSRTEAWQWQARMGVSGPWGASTKWSWSINSLQQGQLLANGNALRLAALDKLGETTTSTVDGRYPLQAQSWRLNANTLGATFASALDENLQLQVVSELAQIKEYYHDRADLQWVQSGTNGSLQGKLHQTGTRQYGFLMHEAPDAGRGYWLHARLDWTHSHARLSAQVNNLWSRLAFDNIHFSETDYQVQTINGQLQLGKIPSVSGVYGMHSTRLSLPRVWQWSARLHDWPRWEVGQKGIGQIGRVYMAYQQPVMCGQIRLETVQLKNWTLGAHCAFFNRQLRLSAGMSTDARFAHPVISQAQIQWMW